MSTSVWTTLFVPRTLLIVSTGLDTNTEGAIGSSGTKSVLLCEGERTNTVDNFHSKLTQIVGILRLFSQNRSIKHHDTSMTSETCFNDITNVYSFILRHFSYSDDCWIPYLPSTAGIQTWPHPFEQHFWSAEHAPSLSHSSIQIPAMPSVLGQVPGWTTVWKLKRSKVILLSHFGRENT